MPKILNKCPVCGSKLEYSSLTQYSDIFEISPNGTFSKKRTMRDTDRPMERGFMTCSNSSCSFHVGCDLHGEKYDDIKIYD